MLSFVLHHHNLALYYREGDMMKKGMLLKLFVTNLYLSAFTFGGGYVIVTLMKKKYVDEFNWIDDFSDDFATVCNFIISVSVL